MSSSESQQRGTEMHRPVIETVPSLAISAVMPDFFPNNNLSFNYDVTQEVVKAGKNYNFELIRV